MVIETKYTMNYIHPIRDVKIILNCTVPILRFSVPPLPNTSAIKNNTNSILNKLIIIKSS